MDEIITSPIVRFLTLANDKETIKHYFNDERPEFVILSINDIPGEIINPSGIYQKEIIGYYCPCNKQHPHDAPESVTSGKFIQND